MKYIPLRGLEDVTNALNFDTADCRVVGSCDLYTTKAAGSDKKLYKNIEHSLESQYETLLRFSVSLSPPQASVAAAALNLSRSSPFGSLSQISSRRTFAYLIATLNASHPDYEFSHLLRPSDFRREKSLRLVMNTLDTTLYNLRPRSASRAPSGASHWSSSSGGAPPSAAGAPPWTPKMWRTLDKEMHLAECDVYAYSPEHDLWDGEEGVIWSLNYFFFHKARKRVCYIYLRGLSLTSHGSGAAPTPVPSEDAAGAAGAGGFADPGASKRADFWFGDRAARALDGEPEEEVWDDGDEPRLLSPKVPRTFTRTAEESASPFSERSRDGRSRSGQRNRSKSTVRGMSEGFVEAMEV